MEEKKPGPRDISDLKARLGLKKAGAVPAAAPVQGTPPFGQPAAIPPPAGLGGPSAGPPPPFGQPAAAAAPAPQAPPDPRRDPFAQQMQQQAANLAAFYGIGQQLPGSSEGMGDAPISKPKPWGRVGLIAVVALVALGGGNACGRIYSSRVNFNQTIDQSIQIRTEVEGMSKQLNLIVDTLRTHKGQVDLELAGKLASLDLKKPDTKKIFHTNYYFLEDLAIERLFSYYNDTIALYALLTTHGKKTDSDKDTLESFLKAGAGKSDKNYGVTINYSDAIPTATLVEIGPPVCPEEGQVDCNAKELKGFKYRTESGGAWLEKPVKGKPGDTVTPIRSSPLFASVASGSPDVLAYQSYVRRMKDIQELAIKIAAGQKDLLADLKRSADRPKVFTF